ncbi:gamma carbonic anhydrase family protein [Streptomyces sp. NPDC002701]|uniref:gamma carbonic anhydrase family protein n=1 Tax=Streptomyces sp. NPDC002701 TaxID=3364661 RepID=UPI0036A55528
MLIEHRGQRPVVPASAYVAPSAVLCGAVTLGERARVLHGAVLTAEDGEVRTGADVVIMENALVRGRRRHPAIIGDAVLIGPHAHINGARVEDEVFVATGAAAFPGAVVGAGSELRINSVLHANSVLPPGTVVPIGWIAAGAPRARLFSPDQHDELWEVQAELDFPGTVYGVPRGTSMRDIMAGQADHFGAHLADRVVEDRLIEDRPAQDRPHDDGPPAT